MKYIVYQVDNDFNIINKFMFKDEAVTFEYIIKHILEEPEVNFILMKLNENKDIESVRTYRSGKCVKIFS